MKAYAFATGEIEFGQRVPYGALAFSEGPAKLLREIVSAQARHAHDGETLLVPGIPEADNQDDALDALILFRSRVEARLRKETGR